MSVTVGPGSTFGGYLVESLVGRGGMGVVYRATDLSLQRPVALKLIAPKLAQDERFRARFLREPRLAASLDHPNVIPIYEAGEHDGQLYLVMRFVEGSDLKALLGRERKLAPERAMAVLAQVAGALDAAHRRGLVHRDVKPANVLLDQEGHVYLTDFGITKQLGGDSTDTAQVVGTLDYLAPEQIRTETVDGRTDCYALACVLYECLSGAPPFRRDTEAETMWAHMQEQPAPLEAHPALDPVLQKALAKEKDDRYASCSELIEAAAQALGVGTPQPARRPRVAPGLLRRGRVIVAAGLLVVGAAIAAVIVALTSGNEGGELAPVGNGVAAIDPAEARIASFTKEVTPPSNIAVGEGAVWVLNTEDQTVSRIDPQTKAVTRRFRTRGVPSDLAVGEGALWVGNGGGQFGNFTVSISRLDPKSGEVTRTVKLLDPTGSGSTGTFNWGSPQIAVGAGAVWAADPGLTVSRIDPASGRLVARFEADARLGIAAGEEGVWFLSPQGGAVTRIDPRTNRVGQTIPIGSVYVGGIAVGAGSVWATGEKDGLVWRIEPGPDAATRSIDVGAGVTYIAFGAGAIWTANFIDGMVSRIDPRTNTVTARVPIGAAQALAAGAGSAWVSTAGRTAEGTLPASACGELVSGPERPDVLIASDLPLQGPQGAGPRAMADAIRLVLTQRGFRAGRHTVGYRSCDDSTAQTGAFENRKCAANANAYAQAKQLVALIGPYNSYCSAIEIPILNRAPGGPLAMISPTNTDPELTRADIHEGFRGAPDVFYPTGVRNYVRLRPGEDLQGVAQAVHAKRLGLQRVYVLDDGPGLLRSLLSDPFRRTAGKLGVSIAGSATFDPEAESYDQLADKVARSGAQGVLMGAELYYGGDRLLKALRARLGARVPIMTGHLFPPADTLKFVGGAARGLYLATTDLPRAVLPLNAAGRRFARDVAGADTPLDGVLEAGQAAELVLDAIARSDGTRASVLKELRASEVEDDILGSFRFDRNGDITPDAIAILRIVGSTPPDIGLPGVFRGAIVDRVVKRPARLLD
jgi:ABC-type branched-subunit amino acid transport system substrate-binding protein/DNA-binding beta-propeller fold protein YncE